MMQTLTCILLVTSGVNGLRLPPSKSELKDQGTAEEQSGQFVFNIPTDISGEEIIQDRAQWLQRPSTKSCSALKNKWVYIRGDSTTRQVVQYFLGDHGAGMNDTAMKSFVRQSKQCERPPHSASYEDFAKIHPEYGHTTCAANERRCTWSYGDKSKITYDWQHFILEEREKFLFNASAMKEPDHDFKDGLPDVLVMGIPLHTCFHTNKLDMWKVKKNQEAEDTYRGQIRQLVSSVRSVYKGPIVWLEAGGQLMSDNEDVTTYMGCLTKMNQELKSAVENDAGSRIVPREAIEQKWIQEHHYDQQNMHKARGCIERIYNSICSSVTV